MKKALTIEELKNRIGKPVFVIATTEEFKNKTAWYVVSKIHEFKADNENRGYIEFTDYDYIDLEKIQFFKFFDTEVTETELVEILKEEEKAKKKTGYERVREGEKYWNTRGGAFLDDDNFLNVLYLHGDYFNDKKLAENIARAEQLKYQLRRYAALNGGIPSPKDWENLEREKNYILYDYVDDKLGVYDRQVLKEIGQIYFKNKEVCEKAIEIFKDELIWYFTEFEEMLY